MNPMQNQMFMIEALRRNMQQPQPQVQPQVSPVQQQNPLDVAYNNLLQMGMGHDQALEIINRHMQSRQQPVSHQMTQGDQLTNNSRQEQGRGTASAQYPDGASND
jgi:hypothetical protein